MKIIRKKNNKFRRLSLQEKIDHLNGQIVNENNNVDVGAKVCSGIMRSKNEVTIIDDSDYVAELSHNGGKYRLTTTYFNYGGGVWLKQEDSSCFAAKPEYVFMSKEDMDKEIESMKKE